MNVQVKEKRTLYDFINCFCFQSFNIKVPKVRNYYETIHSDLRKKSLKQKYTKQHQRYIISTINDCLNLCCGGFDPEKPI